jgi:hypothetical protein
MADTPNKGFPEISASQTLKHVTHNTGLRVLDGIVQANVIDKDDADAPTGPADGDTYLIATGTTSGDDWDDPSNGGVEGAFAYFNSTAWLFTTPEVGWLVYVVDEAKWYVCTDVETDGVATWEVEAGFEHEVSFFFSGKPTSSQEMYRYVFVRAVSYPDEFAGSEISVRVDPAAQTVIDIQKNAVSIGDVTIEAGSVAGAFNLDSGAIDFAAQDVLTFIGPGSADADMEDIAVTLLGTKS